MVDIKSFLAALKISWLKRILHDDEKKKKKKTFKNPTSNVSSDSECKTERW